MNSDFLQRDIQNYFLKEVFEVCYSIKNAVNGKKKQLFPTVVFYVSCFKIVIC